MSRISTPVSLGRAFSRLLATYWRGEDGSGGGDSWARMLLQFILVWPVVIVLVALIGWSPLTAAVSLFPLLPLAVLLLLSPSVTAGLWLTDDGKTAINLLLLVVGVELLIGWFFSHVPVWNDRMAVPQYLLTITTLLFAVGLAFKRIMRYAIPFLAGTMVLWTATFFLGGRDEAKERVKDLLAREAPAPRPVRLAIAAPVVRDPLESADVCPLIYAEQIPAGSAARDSIAENGAGTYTLYWTAGNPTRPLLEGVAWPLLPDSTRAREAKVRVTHLTGHLDMDDHWDSATGQHLVVSVTDPRNDLGYCLGRLYYYPLSRGFLEQLWPGAVGVAPDPDDPNRKPLTFSRGPIEFLVEDGENPTLFFLNSNPLGNGRRHRAQFKIEISPA